MRSYQNLEKVKKVNKMSKEQTYTLEDIGDVKWLDSFAVGGYYYRCCKTKTGQEFYKKKSGTKYEDYTKITAKEYNAAERKEDKVTRSFKR